MVNKWISDNYQDLRTTLLNITRNDTEYIDDLLHEVIIIFMEKDISEQLVKDKKAKFYIIRIALNQYRSKTSDFHKRYRKNPTISLNEALTVDSGKEYDNDYDELLKLNLNIIEDMLRSDHPNHKHYAMIMMLYFSNDNNFAKVSRLLKVPRTTIRRQFDEGAKIVLRKMKSYKDTGIEYGDLPLKILATKVLENYGINGRRY
jgi:hypothetical protein